MKLICVFNFSSSVLRISLSVSNGSVKSPSIAFEDGGSLPPNSLGGKSQGQIFADVRNIIYAAKINTRCKQVQWNVKIQARMEARHLLAWYAHFIGRKAPYQQKSRLRHHIEKNRARIFVVLRSHDTHDHDMDIQYSCMVIMWSFITTCPAHLEITALFAVCAL